MLGKTLEVELKGGSISTQTANSGRDVKTLPQPYPNECGRIEGTHVQYVYLLSTADTLTRDEGVTEFRFGLRQRVLRPEKIYLMA